MTNQELYDSKKSSVEEILNLIRSGDRITAGSDNNEAQSILAQLHTIAGRVQNVTVRKGRSGSYSFVHDPGMHGHIDCECFFFSPDLVQGFGNGSTTLIPVDLPSYPGINESYKPTEVYIGSVSPMDENGDMTIGYAMMFTPEAIETVLKNHGRILLEVNKQLRPVKGGCKINIKDVTALVEVDRPMVTIPASQTSETEKRIGEYVAELVHDGDTIQLGIGGIPDAAAHSLMSKKELGLHTEMFTSSMGEMIRKGVITGERKNFLPGVHIGTFAGGDQALYDTMANDPRCQIGPGSFVVNPMTIMKNDNMVSVNTIVGMDLTGQACSESIGPRQISGAGGAFAFAFGAFHSKGGRGILAFESRTKKGVSKITPFLPAGSAVTIPRNYVDYVVTEYGIAAMKGRTVRERVEALIAIAHPDVREDLRKEARRLLYI